MAVAAIEMINLVNQTGFRLLVLVVCLLLPMALPVMYLRNQYKEKYTGLSLREEDFVMGLPYVSAVTVDWLKDWMLLGQDFPIETTVEIPVIQVDDRVPPVHEEFHIAVFGDILEDSRRLYCLYDIRKERWFRLSAGEVDREARVRLDWDIEAGAGIVVCLESGNRYAIKPGEKELERVENEGK